MASVNELKKLIIKENRKARKVRKFAGKAGEKARLKSELFQLKHGNKIRIAKKIGKGFKTAGGNLAYNVKNIAGGFEKSRKKKKGVGGFLQRIADNQ